MRETLRYRDDIIRAEGARSSELDKDRAAGLTADRAAFFSSAVSLKTWREKSHFISVFS